MFNKRVLSSNYKLKEMTWNEIMNNEKSWCWIPLGPNINPISQQQTITIIAEYGWNFRTTPN